MDNKLKRLFFAFEAHSPWEKTVPKGRLLNKRDRHLTVVFLGSVHWPSFRTLLNNLPLPSLKVGLTGIFDRLLFLPPKRPNVVAYHAKWTYKGFDFGAFQTSLAHWLEERGFPVRLHRSGFLPHVTVCRRPFSQKEWEAQFTPLPFYISNFHLYESHPGLTYRPIWTHSIIPPFDSKYIYGEEEKQLAIHKKFANKYGQLFTFEAHGNTPLPQAPYLIKR